MQRRLDDSRLKVAHLETITVKENGSHSIIKGGSACGGVQTSCPSAQGTVHVT